LELERFRTRTGFWNGLSSDSKVSLYPNILNLCFTLQNHVHIQRTKGKVIVAYILMIRFYTVDREKKDS